MLIDTHKYNKELTNMLKYLNETNPSQHTTTIELELRFKNIPIDCFYRILSVLSKSCNPREQYILDHFTSDSRYSLFEGKKYHRTVKTRIFDYQIPDFDIKASLSSEYCDPSNVYILTDTDYNNTKTFSTSSIKMSRKKKRYSFKFIGFKIDLTIVSGNSNPKDTWTDATTAVHFWDNDMCHRTYEIELEMIKGSTFKDLIDGLYYILKLKHDNFIVPTLSQTESTLHQYNALTKTKFATFIGAQPETLHGKDLKNLYTIQYAVTKKLDGDRCLLFVNQDAEVYAINSNANQIFVTDLKSPIFVNTLIDCERTTSKTNVTFHCFDILIHNGIDLRHNQDYLLKERLDLLQNVISTIQSEKYYTVLAKEYIFKDIFVASKLLYSPDDSDGLVYVPINDPYPLKKKWPGLYKWKPVELNTIDFYSINVSDNIWELYVTQPHQNEKNSTKTQIVLFDVEKLTGEKTHDTTFKTTFSKDLQDPSTGITYKSNTVIEYRYDTNLSLFVPLKTRWDKTVNPNKHGNFKDVALDIWNNIHNPVTLDTITKLVIYDKVPYYKTFRYSVKKVKEKLYRTFTKSNSKVLELGCGKGGDTVKCKNGSIVHGYDIDQNAINECKTKIKGQNHLFTQLDLTDKLAHQQVKNNSKLVFDVAFSHFSIQYFFKSKETLDSFIDIIDTNLKTNGSFIISTIDSKKLSQLCNNEAAIHYIGDNKEVLYYITHEPSLKKWGNIYDMSLNGNNQSMKGLDEYIIDTDFFIEYMKERGYELSNHDFYSEEFNNQNDKQHILEEYEQDIFNLYRYLIFTKTEDILLKVTKRFQGLSIDKPIQKPTVVCKAIKMTKITNINQIIDSIQERGYTTKLFNKKITSKQDIITASKDFPIPIEFIEEKPSVELPSDKIYIYIKNNLKSTTFYIVGW